MKFYCSECAKPFEFDPASPEKQIACPLCAKKYDKPEGLGAGIVIADFLIEKLLSRGGMGEVFLARQLSLDRPVALKVLQKKFTGNQEYVDSLIHEARAAAKINHPNIVQAYTVGEEDGTYYFAMEYIRGETFKKILNEKGVLDFKTAAKVIRDVAGALDVAWREQKLVHQDIKPDNIMVDANGFTKLADLGLAKTAGMDNGDDDSDEVLGTPQYISPEQLTGVPTDVRSDLYSLGATFYHFVTGHFAYEADTAEEITRMHVEGKLTPPQIVNPELPDALNAIIVRMMARNIDERYQEPGTLIHDLDQFLSGTESNTASPKLSLPRTGTKASLPKLSVPGKGTPANGSAPKLSVPKPAVPKSAVPKPAVPKPAVPKPIVPSPAAPKPAVPAPAVPKPEEAKEKKAETTPPASPEENSKQPEKKDDAGKKKEKPEKKKMEPVKRRRIIILLSVWGTVSLLVLLFAAVITGCVLERLSKLPPVFQPPCHAINQAVNRMLGAARDKALEMAKPEERTYPEAKEKDPAVTRPEYMEMLDGIIAWHNANSGKSAELVQKVDAIWPQAIVTVTDEERSKLEHFAGVFAAHDEELRCREARTGMVRKHNDRLAAIDAKLQAEEDKRKQAELDREKARLENQEKAKKMAEQRAVEEKERQALLQTESRKIDALTESVAEAMGAAVASDRDAELQKAVTEAMLYQLPAAVIGNEIPQKVARMRKFCTDSQKMFTTVREYRTRLAQIDENSNIRVMFPRRSAVVISIQKGEIRCRGNDKKVFLLNLTHETPRTRASLYKALQSRKFDHPAFYLGLFAGEMDSVAIKDIPGGYWKDHWALLKKYIH